MDIIIEDLQFQALRGIEDLNDRPYLDKCLYLHFRIMLSQTQNGLQHLNNPNIDQMLFPMLNGEDQHALVKKEGDGEDCPPLQSKVFPYCHVF